MWLVFYGILQRMRILILLVTSLTIFASYNVFASSGSLISKECITEPIFNGTACVYQSNPKAEKTIVLVHGLNGSALHDWQYQIPYFAKNYHVLTFDLPGFGDSAKDVANYSPRQYAKFINFIVKRYARKKTIVVAHSMGGAISLRYSEMYPENIEKLVLVDVAGVLHRLAYSRQLMKGWFKAKVSDDSRVLSFADSMANKFLNKAEPVVGPLSRFMDKYVVQDEFFEMGSSTISAVSLVHEDLSDAISSIKLPTLIVWGEKDSIAPLRTAKVLKRSIPQSHLKLIKNAAHVPMIDEPEKFNQIVSNYLNGNDPVAKVSVTKNDNPKSETCNNEVGKVYEGSFESLSIINCSQILIRNAHIEELVVRLSSVVIENSNIVSSQNALDVFKSEILITASKLSGKTAINASGSRLDLAGVALVGETFSVTASANSTIVFSVSNIDSDYETREIHEFVKVDETHPL